MLNFLRRCLGSGSAVFGFLLMFTQFAGVIAAPISEADSSELMAQVTSVSYLRGYDDGGGDAPPGGFFGSRNATFPFGPEVAPAIPPESVLLA